MQVYISWVPTEVNPVDGPSRRYKFDSMLGFPGEGPRSFLFEAVHRPGTLERYRGAVGEFTSYLSALGLSADTPERLDEFFAEWCHELYAVHDGRDAAGRLPGRLPSALSRESTGSCPVSKALWSTLLSHYSSAVGSVLCLPSLPSGGNPLVAENTYEA